MSNTSARRLRVVVFPGGFNWPIWVAQAKGFFERLNLKVELTPTPNSAYQLTSLIAGDFDVAHTAFDNIVAYNERQIQTQLRRTPDLFAFMGGDNGLLRFITKADIRTYADLKGQQLSVDALTTGYAFVLRSMLEANGLGKDDYELVSVGGGLERWKALQHEGPVGTLLITPFELLAKEEGFRLLGNAADVLGRYQGLVGAANRGWAASHHEELTGYIRAYLAALAWLYDPGNRDEAVELLIENTTIAPYLSNEVYDVLVDPAQGVAPAATLDVRGMEAVLALRNRYLIGGPVLSNVSKYFDLSYYNAATYGPDQA